ncbi:hypothetical protein ANO11243_045150 [Dothideomycetidae sp. 11243]|nr:hypothetical protein ANO11243_045150 [fungal sp. No.11243]
MGVLRIVSGQPAAFGRNIELLGTNPRYSMLCATNDSMVIIADLESPPGLECRPTAGFFSRIGPEPEPSHARTSALALNLMATHGPGRVSPKSPKLGPAPSKLPLVPRCRPWLLLRAAFRLRCGLVAFRGTPCLAMLCYAHVNRLQRTPRIRQPDRRAHTGASAIEPYSDHEWLWPATWSRCGRQLCVPNALAQCPRG